MIILWLIRCFLLTNHFLGNHLTLNQNLHLIQDHFSLSQDCITLSQVQNPTPVIHLIIPVIHSLQNLECLVQAKAKVPYPSQFVRIVNNLVIDFWMLGFERKRENEKPGAS